jgi:hypothetical protein
MTDNRDYCQHGIDSTRCLICLADRPRPTNPTQERLMPTAAIQSVDILGPNLPTEGQRLGSLHVHAHDCDCRRVASEEAWTVPIDSRRAAVLAVYADHDATEDNWQDFDDLWLAPCVRVPILPIEHPAQTPCCGSYTGCECAAEDRVAAEALSPVEAAEAARPAYGGEGCTCRLYDDGNGESGPHLAVEEDEDCPVHRVSLADLVDLLHRQTDYAADLREAVAVSAAPREALARYRRAHQDSLALAEEVREAQAIREARVAREAREAAALIEAAQHVARQYPIEDTADWIAEYAANNDFPIVEVERLRLLAAVIRNPLENISTTRLLAELVRRDQEGA